MTMTSTHLSVRKPTLRELFTYTDWTRDLLYQCAAGLTDAELDRPFEMGMGSLRETFNHIAAVERVWLERCKHVEQPLYRASGAGWSVSRLLADARGTSTERDAFFDSLSDGDLSRSVSYRNLKGQPFAFPLGMILLHVANHGQHHRAQALNMLRHIGAALPKPGPDYIFMKLAESGGGTNSATPPSLDIETLRSHAAYDEWAQHIVLGVAEQLSDEQLDRKFDLGIGTIRGTLAHIRFAEHWWLECWTIGPDNPFPEMPPTISVRDLRQLTDETFAGRRAFFAKLSDGDLRRFVKAQPRPGTYREFALGVTILQTGFHGTHHRAQIVNMLRHVGAPTPALDLLRMFE